MSSPELRFEPKEADTIRAAFASRQDHISCPRCGEALTWSRPVGGGGTVPPIYEVRCETCRCGTVAAAGH